MAPPLDVLPLLPELNHALITFLKGLPPEAWQRQTVARQWKIKDVVAHLLDGNLRRISIHRDQWSVQPDTPIHSNGDLVNYLNVINADWVKATRRLSPQLLVELLETSNGEVYALFSRLDPYGESVYPVGWAGEEKSYNWFDIAREYTERWIHQQQIRDAMGNRELLAKKFYHPLLDIFMYAWPVAMGEAGEEQATIKTVITGEGGGEWILQKSEGKWKPGGKATAPVLAETTIDGDVAWKLFSKSIRKEDITGSYRIQGDQQLGGKILSMVSVMA